MIRIRATDMAACVDGFLRIPRLGETWGNRVGPGSPRKEAWGFIMLPSARRGVCVPLSAAPYSTRTRQRQKRTGRHRRRLRANG